MFWHAFQFIVKELYVRAVRRYIQEKKIRSQNYKVSNSILFFFCVLGEYKKKLDTYEYNRNYFFVWKYLLIINNDRGKLNR